MFPEVLAVTTRRRATLTILKLADLTVVGVAMIIALGATLSGGDVNLWLSVMQMRVTVQNALFVAAYLSAWHFLLKGLGLYRSYRIAPASREVGAIGIAVVLGVLPLVPAAQVFDFAYVNDRFILAFTSLSFLGLVIERRGARLLARELRRQGMNLRNALVIGDAASANSLSATLEERRDLGYQILPSITVALDAERSLNEIESEVKARLEAAMTYDVVDEVFIALPLVGAENLVRNIIAHCEEQGIMVRVLARIANLEWARLMIDEVAGQPVLSIVSGPPDTLQLTVKRALDMSMSTLGMLVFLPVFMIVAVAIKVDSKGPIIFVQERVGQNRRRFKTLKFRTMIDGADAVQADLEHLNEASGPVFKIRDDPRVTRVGKWLRRTSVDELPQLYNVMRGDMSLVGPRPLPVRDVEKMDVRWHKRRFAVKPGITCLWQANHREPNFDEWIKSDMEYIDNWSLGLDLKILLKTIPAVFMGNGAH
jgi:exopolysaccharide biosynthesis polyprenyl glycosylphosphotransferase